MGSTRLPGKILKPFIGAYTPLSWLIERARLSTLAERVIVATTANPKDDATEAACKEIHCDIYRGSEDNVLDRYLQAIKTFDSKIILQINGDVPFVDIVEMDRLGHTLIDEGLDYANNHPTALPLGAGSEAYTAEAFIRMAALTQDPYDLGNVTPYFYNHLELFKQTILEPVVPHPFAKEEDLVFLQALAEEMDFSRPEEQPTTNEILGYLEAHPELVAINKNVIQKTFPKADN
jgi:spore coat polysaccharide biosynthesis protein SpsF (cytidylyltransferase family)